MSENNNEIQKKDKNKAVKRRDDDDDDDDDTQQNESSTTDGDSARDDSDKARSERESFLEWVHSRFAALDIDADDDDDAGASPNTAPRFDPLSRLKGNLSLQGVADYISGGECRKICFMTGAGISTSAGIPDFRSPGSGLYDTMAERFQLDNPQSLFEINYFMANPQPFLFLAKELLAAEVKPTVSHYFQRLLEQKGLLLRSFTQNVDALEMMAGMSEERVVEAHGSMKGAHCLGCRRPYSREWFKQEVMEDRTPSCEECNELVKPDIVFFNENLPERFFKRVQADLPVCDLLIIMGTSLVVQPFASMIDQVGRDCPRLLINREKAGTVSPFMALLGVGGLRFDDPRNDRDVFWAGSCDDGCMELAKLLHWDEELKSLVEEEHAKLDNVNIGRGSGSGSSSSSSSNESGRTSDSQTNNNAGESSNEKKED